MLTFFTSKTARDLFHSLQNVIHYRCAAINANVVIQYELSLQLVKKRAMNFFKGSVMAKTFVGKNIIIIKKYNFLFEILHLQNTSPSNFLSIMLILTFRFLHCATCRIYDLECFHSISRL